MRKIIFGVLLLISSTSYGQISIDTTSRYIFDPETNTKTDWSMYLGAMDSIPPSALEFDTISRSEFEGYKKMYRSKINIDTSKVLWTDTSFVISEKNWSRNYNIAVTEEEPFNNYMGYLEPLSLYLVTSIDGRNETAMFSLVDQKTGKEFYLNSGFDYPCVIALISPKNNFLLSWSNNEYEYNESMLVVLKVEKQRKKFQLKGFVDFSTNQWRVQDVVWINENSIALHVDQTEVEDGVKTGKHTEYFFKTSMGRD